MREKKKAILNATQINDGPNIHYRCRCTCQPPRLDRQNLYPSTSSLSTPNPLPWELRQRIKESIIYLGPRLAFIPAHIGQLFEKINRGGVQ